MERNVIGIAVAVAVLSFLAGWFSKGWRVSSLAKRKQGERDYRRSLTKLSDRRKNIGRRIYNALATAIGKCSIHEDFAIRRDEGDRDGLYKIVVYRSDDGVFSFAGVNHLGSKIFWIEIDEVGPDPIEVVYFSEAHATPGLEGKVSARLNNDDESVKKLIEDLQSQYFRED